MDEIDEIIDLGQGALLIGGLETPALEGLAAKLEELEQAGIDDEVELDTTPDRR